MHCHGENHHLIVIERIGIVKPIIIQSTLRFLWCSVEAVDHGLQPDVEQQSRHPMRRDIASWSWRSVSSEVVERTSNPTRLRARMPTNLLIRHLMISNINVRVCCSSLYAGSYCGPPIPLVSEA